MPKTIYVVLKNEQVHFLTLNGFRRGAFITDLQCQKRIRTNFKREKIEFGVTVYRRVWIPRCTVVRDYHVFKNAMQTLLLLIFPLLFLAE